MEQSNEKSAIQNFSNGILGLIGLSVVIFSLYQLYDLATWRTNLDGKTERQAFAQSVLQKKTTEVIKLYGRPDRTTPLSGNISQWQYQRKTYDSISGKVDNIASIEVVGDTAYETDFF